MARDLTGGYLTGSTQVIAGSCAICVVINADSFSVSPSPGVIGLFGKGEWGGDANGDIRLILHDVSGIDYLKCVVRTSGGDHTAQVAVSTLTTATTYVIYGEYDTTAGKVRLDVNGVQVSEVSVTGTLSDNSHAIAVGAYPNNLASTAFDGRVAEAAIFKPNLSPDDRGRLGRFYSPASFAEIFRYWRILGSASPEPEFFGAASSDLTVTAPASAATHPGMVMPPMSHWNAEDSGGAGSTLPSRVAAPTEDGTLSASASWNVVNGQIALRCPPQHGASVADLAKWDFIGDFTIIARVVFHVLETGVTGIVSHADGYGLGGKWFIFGRSSGVAPGRTYFEFSNGTGGGFALEAPTGWTPTIGTSYGLAVTRAGTTFTFYRDGSSDGTDTESASLVAIAASLIIGDKKIGSGSGSSSAKDISVIALRFYNSALADADIALAMTADATILVARTVRLPIRWAGLLAVSRPIVLPVRWTGALTERTVRLLIYTGVGEENLLDSWVVVAPALGPLVDSWEVRGEGVVGGEFIDTWDVFESGAGSPFQDTWWVNARPHQHSGTAGSGGSTSTIHMDDDDEAANIPNAYVGSTIVITSGPAAGTTATITAYNHVTHIATVDPGTFPASPDGATYELYGAPIHVLSTRRVQRPFARGELRG